MRSAPLSLTLVVFLALATLLAAQEPTDANPETSLMPQQDPAQAPSTAPPASASNPAILRVNGEPIFATEISMVMQTIASQLQARGETVDNTELAKVATQRAIEQKLLVQEARRFGLKPDELLVAQAAQAAEQQAGGRALLEAKLQATGSNYDQFLNVIREIELLRVFVERQIKPNVTVTDEEIAAYYKDNIERFVIEDSAHAYHMIFVANEGSGPEAMEAARAKAEAARQRALTGDEDFTTLARELSEGPSAPAGGDLGWVTRGALVAPVSVAVFTLEPGEISEVVQSRFGFHVITVTERRAAGTVGLDEVSDQIASVLRQQKATATVGELLATLVETARVENLVNSATGGQLS